MQTQYRKASNQIGEYEMNKIKTLVTRIVFFIVGLFIFVGVAISAVSSFITPDQLPVKPVAQSVYVAPLLTEEEQKKQHELRAIDQKKIDAKLKEDSRLFEIAEKKRKAEAKKQGVSLGMTKQQALESKWGKPNSINATTSKYSEREQWVYGNGNYLYFKNGTLESIQN